MARRVLFAKYDVFNVAADRKAQLKAEYDRLPDNDATDETVVQRLKAKWMLHVPLLKASEMSYEERKSKIDARRLPNRIFLPGTGPVLEDATDLIFHIPFDGDPSVFDIAPSASNSRFVEGEIVGQELLLHMTIVDSSYDIQGHIDREIQQVNWALTHLREKDAYFSQELGAVLAHAITNRKRVMESRSNIAGKLKISQRQSVPQAAPTPAPSTHSSPMEDFDLQKRGGKRDVFISHASEDKAYVEPLVEALETAGVSVWYDRLVMEWGDDLRPMIDNGLVNCRYGIVVLSKAFLGKKKWTEHELNGLFAREQAGKKLVLPIWHGITRDDLFEYSPTLADRLAKMSKTDSYADIVNSLFSILGRSETDDKRMRPASGETGPGKSGEISKFAKAHRTLRTSEELSFREIELLWTAAQDRTGEILHSMTLDGESIRSNNRHFLKESRCANCGRVAPGLARS